jgi:serine/threonine protein kinase
MATFSPEQPFRLLSTSMFGSVMMGYDPDGVAVAIKQSQKSLMDSKISIHGASVLEDPITEGKMLEAVQGHPNIVQWRGSFMIEDTHYLVVDYVADGEFFFFLQRQPLMSEAEVRLWFRQMVSAIAFLHQKQVCHLDISLENFFVDLSNQSVRLGDFGLSRFGDYFEGSDNPPGKLRYMSPELVRHQAFSGKAADMFALGVCLFCMLTKSSPFQVATYQDRRFASIQKGQTGYMVKMARGANPSVSDDLIQLLSRLLHFDAKQRPTITEVVQLLDKHDRMTQ